MRLLFKGSYFFRKYGISRCLLDAIGEECPPTLKGLKYMYARWHHMPNMHVCIQEIIAYYMKLVNSWLESIIEDNAEDMLMEPEPSKVQKNSIGCV